MSEQPLGTEIAGYRIESVIGRGGMAVVYRAEDTRLGRKVALKLLTPALSDQEHFKQRFIKESRLAASLDHPNIIPIYEAGNADGVLFIAMRYVVGSDLKVALSADNPMPAARVSRLFEQIGDALDAAHNLGLVHRDVKPGNILLTSLHEKSDHVYLTDFGLTKRASSLSAGLTGTGHFLGTIDYVAPEQITSKPVDARTDIYALGCVLYECLTGQVPFHRDDDAATMWAHLVDPPPPVTAVRHDLSPAVDDVVARAMAKAPEDRYDSCHQLVQELKAALEVPVSVRAARSPSGVDPSGADRLDDEHEQRTHIRETDPDAPAHPSFPPGVLNFVRNAPPPALTPGQPKHAIAAPLEAPAPSEALPAPVAADEVEADYGEEPEPAEPEQVEDSDWDFEDEVAAPAAARSGRRRWLLVALIAAVAVLATIAALVLLPGKRTTSLSSGYTSGPQFASVVRFSLKVPVDWTHVDGTGEEVVLSPAAGSVANLFFNQGFAGIWTDARAVLAANRSKATGLWLHAASTAYDRSSTQNLEADLRRDLPQDASFTSAPRDQLVGGMPSDEIEGQLADPDDASIRLQFIANAIRYRSATNSGSSLLVVFFAAPDRFDGQRGLFDRIRATIDLPPN